MCVFIKRYSTCLSIILIICRLMFVVYTLSLSLSLNSEAWRAASVCILMFCFFRRVFFFSLSLSLSLSFYYVCMMLSLLIKCTHLAPFALAHFRALLNTCSLPLLLVRFHTRARVSTPPRTPSSPLPLSRQSSLNTAL